MLNMRSRGEGWNTVLFRFCSQPGLVGQWPRNTDAIVRRSLGGSCIGFSLCTEHLCDSEAKNKCVFVSSLLVRI